MLSQKRLDVLKNIARKETNKSTYKFKVGCVILDGSRVLSIGHNQKKSHPWTMKYFKFGTIHAEIDAVLSCDRDKLKGSTIFVFRESKRGAPANAKPCPMCLQALNEVGVKVAFWTTREYPYWGHGRIGDLMKDVDFDKALQTNKYRDEI